MIDREEEDLGGRFVPLVRFGLTRKKKANKKPPHALSKRESPFVTVHVVFPSHNGSETAKKKNTTVQNITSLSLGSRMIRGQSGSGSRNV